MATPKQSNQRNSPTIRSFVAVELPEEIHRLLDAQENNLRTAMGRAAGAIRWTRPESVHLTLQFLGDIPVAHTDRISAAITDACKGAQPLKLTVHGIGAFPNVSHPRVLWVGLEGDTEPLRNLSSRISERLKPLGYKPDKPFSPHITLGRIRDTVRPDELRAISEVLASQASQRNQNAIFTVDSVSLMESHLQPGGSVYTQLATIPFEPSS